MCGVLSVRPSPVKCEHSTGLRLSDWLSPCFLMAAGSGGGTARGQGGAPCWTNDLDAGEDRRKPKPVGGSHAASVGSSHRCHLSAGGGAGAATAGL